MHKIALSSLAVVAFSSLALADAHIDLGDSQRVTRLFAYPNNCNVVCYRNWSLEQTVEHYLTQSVRRDGYADAGVHVSRDNDRLYATISKVPANYVAPLRQLLDSGELAYDGATQLNKDGKWSYDWYLFLPLGMALQNRRSIELLHFPPDYSLTQAQDYLRSNTTDRWAELLTFNGVATSQTPAYQTIIDIAPIAAPASAGESLKDTYSYFKDYQVRMVREMTLQNPAKPLPMVAFGAPVRSWIQQQYGPQVGVLGLVGISPQKGTTVPVLGANHPSAIWYAADKASHGGDQDAADTAGLKMMGQDLTAACWQAGMGRNPAAEPKLTLEACATKWQVTQKKQTCELFFRTVRKYTPEQAAAKCNSAAVTRSLRDLRKPVEALPPAL
ncbi:hypothetical protein C4Q28_05080 [Pseudomonas sp. SWI6]|uniref:Uncharacterized protein n=1 Tax=Pseudomonas taiwanensis TaxID=470150 RepID=A0ABR6V8L9_9PSED|nr:MULTISPECIES: hypothetical protein [Pseudomonas]AGZ37095.1 hypothetical protein PVLB_21580 [Pseudomonas sp. VLB120]AVD81576.1 hypothetical protein C4Q28_05080 [Pseudomonas sp. SWI6]AVD88527.1 hypothetical protein C4Q26_15825 [Pseudomonas sp. SWI44]MBC3476515.1 hypothetical protein [Pseudomonas taiwanensis]MBC3490742.1 hypothetical protein [Pseudomonas taiwanensis]